MRLFIPLCNRLTGTILFLFSATAGIANAEPASSCGRISIFHTAPRSEHLYPATIIEIDGHTAGTTRQHSYRVDPGIHRLLVGENIDYRDVTGNTSRQQRHYPYKQLTVDVVAGTTYTVSARLNPDKSVNAKDAAYWDPIVFNEIPETCN